MLYALDIFFAILHLAIIGFNLFGWIHPKTQKAHLITILVTAASWFFLGIWFGIGYCPITDWQWRVKEQLGETNLPHSFVTYYANKLTGKNWDPDVINIVTVTCFAFAAILAVYTNFFKRRK